MKNIGRIMAGVLLAGASHGLTLSDGQGGSVGWVAEVAASNGTSRAEWVLPTGKGMDATRKQYLKMELAGTTDNGFAGFFFGKGEQPLFSVFVSGKRSLAIGPGEYPAAEFFEQADAPAALNWRAQVWPTSRVLRIITPEGAANLSLDPSLSNPAWQTGLARLLVVNASATIYRVAAMDVPSLFMIR